MPDPASKAANGAGCLLAGSIVLATLIGIFMGQPTIGMIAGAGIGLLLALLLWLRDRRR